MILEKFDQLKQNGDMAFIAYMTAGFPSLKESVENFQVLADCGADIIEVGVPFSDPIADGPAIQHASQIALSNGVTLKAILQEIMKIDIRIPLVVMSYLNPLLAYGRERLFGDMNKANFSGLIVPDLPHEESDEWIELSNVHGIDLIFLVAPTSSSERVKLIAEKSKGFIYCVSLTGTTGIRDHLPKGLIALIKKAKQLTTKPVVVGFGISTSEQIAALRGEADGVVVGSRLIEAVRKDEDLRKVAKELKKATRR